MGQINNHTDLTGSMSKDKVNQQDLSTIIDELNRTSDNVDALLNNLTISGYGSMTYVWDGTARSDSVSSPISGNGAQFPITFLTRSDVVGKVYGFPYYVVYNNANNDAVIGIQITTTTNLTNNVFTVSPSFYYTGTPVTFTFYYYLILEPPNITAH